MSEIILYTTEDGITKINVQLENETVWLTTYSTESEPPIPTQSEPLNFRFLE